MVKSFKSWQSSQ
uniref:Uncharacterized protein n=1 Tax=Anguilla anguilla TaxID=7936 RepID=A0A0E9Q8C9_ANGAN